MTLLRFLGVVCSVLLGAVIGMVPMAHPQFMGVLTTPLTVASIGRTNAATEGIVGAQGAGVKVRLLGFFLTADRMVEVQFQDRSGDACTGRLMIATGSALSVPVQPPGWLCETGTNEALDFRITNSGLSQGSPVVGGAFMWQPSQ